MVGLRVWKRGGGSKMLSIASRKSVSQTASSRKTPSRTSASRKSTSQVSTSRSSVLQTAPLKKPDPTSRHRLRNSSTRKVREEEAPDLKPTKAHGGGVGMIPFCFGCTNLWNPYIEDEYSDDVEESARHKFTPHQSVPHKTVPHKSVLPKPVVPRPVSRRPIVQKSVSQKSTPQKSVSQTSATASRHRSREAPKETYARKEESKHDDFDNACNLGCSNLCGPHNDDTDYVDEPVSQTSATANSQKAKDSLKATSDRKVTPHRKQSKVDDGETAFNSGCANLCSPFHDDYDADYLSTSTSSTSSATTAASSLNDEDHEIVNRAETVNRAENLSRLENVKRAENESRPENVNRAENKDRAETKDRTEIKDRANTVKRAENVNRAVSVSDETVKGLEKAIDTLKKHAERKDVKNALSALKDAGDRLGMSESELMNVIEGQKGRRIILAR